MGILSEKMNDFVIYAEQTALVLGGGMKMKTKKEIEECLKEEKKHLTDITIIEGYEAGNLEGWIEALNWVLK